MKIVPRSSFGTANEQTDNQSYTVPYQQNQASVYKIDVPATRAELIAARIPARIVSSDCALLRRSAQNIQISKKLSSYTYYTKKKKKKW